MKKLIVLFLMIVMGIIYMECDNPVNDPNTYKVTYKGNGNTGGSVPTDANSYETGTTVTVQGNNGNLIKTDFTFDGWNTTANGSGIDYTPGATFTMGSANVILYAQWKVTGTVTDIDGNVYRTVQIGNQAWTVENWRTTRYNDGSGIPKLTDNTQWANDNFGAYCYYNNTTNVDDIKKYGSLYNWFAIDTKKLAPKGWHVPTNEEWAELEEYLIANGYNWDGTTTGNKIGKSLASKTDWKVSLEPGHVGNSLTNNSTGFMGLPGGWRKYDGSFMCISEEGQWWSSTEIDVGSPYAAKRKLSYDTENLFAFSYNKEFGLSVKLVMD